MTVSSSVNKVTYSGNSATTVFPVNYYFLENSHLQVILVSNNVETIQTITSQYTVTGAGNPAGGSVTMVAAPPTGTQLIIVRNVPATQETDYLANDPFPAESHERALDKLTMLVQQQTEITSRAIKFPTSDSNLINNILPPSSVRANKLLGFSNNGDVTLSQTTVNQLDAAVSSFVNATGNNAASILYDPSADSLVGPAQLSVESALDQITDDESGSSVVGFKQSGLGSTKRTVEAKLGENVSVKDFGAIGDGLTNDTAAFQAAWAAADPQSVLVPSGDYVITGSVIGNFFSFGGVTIIGGSVTISFDIDANNNLSAKITPEGESTQIDLSAAVRPSGGMNRGRVNYRSVDSVEVIVPEDIVMGGFRFMGQYKKGRAPVYKSGVPYRAIVNFGTDLGAESTPKADNWYAVFACANDGDTNVTYKLMPFLRVGSVVGSLCNLSSNAENTFTDVPTTYSWSAGNDTLAGVDCLVINEGADNRFSGRIATITDSRAGTVVLDTIGQIGALDFLLPAPPNFDHYCYLATFYLETSPVPLGVEARNIADSGVIVMGRNVNNTDPNWTSTGAVAGPPGNKIEWSTLISPLATGAYFISTIATSTSGGGDIFTHFSHDGSNHEVAVHSYYKAIEATSSAQTSNTFVCFSQGQFMYFWVDGSLASSRISSNLLGTGWIEP
jgi:hypothetical protein